MLVKLKQHLIMFALTREIQQNINCLCRVIFGHEWVNVRRSNGNVVLEKNAQSIVNRKDNQFRNYKYNKQ